MRVVSHKPFLLATLGTSSAERTCLYRSHRNKSLGYTASTTSLELLLFSHFSGVPYILLQSSNHSIHMWRPLLTSSYLCWPALATGTCKWIKQEVRSHLHHPWGWCPWLQDRDIDVKPFEVGFTLQVSHLSQLVTLVSFCYVMHGRYSITWPPVYLQSCSQ
jgi:hypothetical protein